ncbi:histidine phosphatase family protein [Pseudanabaena sp. FACHB-2040]|uniref:SixA phosphatase family protein n=1 Tax=Pseudanabaena sp. FACHB-2040 TaxID=2692859 RepID=UPI00168A2A13|nr:histidine phosphatase family protein [Pseudanabaena sp. FACHB-2040]MBD2258670.1 histidine phosphatase family protein [Pseudanabaena sp. FACHB-2040]
MEKHLILFRHGKSDWAAEFQRDHERPVAKRGIKAAKAMGKLLAAAGQVPDSIVSSSAVRAKTTAELAAEAGGWGCPLRVTDQLYEATPEEVMTVIQQEPDTTRTLMLVGHEPTWSELTGRLIGSGRVLFPTAAMVRIDFELSSWEQIAFGLGQLVWLIPPKLFTEGDFEGV